MPQNDAGALQRFLTAFKEDLLDPLAHLSRTSLTAIAGSGAARGRAQGELLSIPGQMASAAKQSIETGADKVGAAIQPGSPTSSLSQLTLDKVAELEQQDPRTLTDQELELVVQARSARARNDPSMSTSERVGLGVSGAMDIASPAAMAVGGALGGAPAGALTSALRSAGGAALGGVLGPVARMPAHRAEEGDVAGALGSLAGIGAPEIPRGVRAGARAAQGRPVQGGQPVRRPSSVELQTGRGATVDLPTTRGETGSAAFQVAEEVARGAPLSGRPVRNVDRARVQAVQDFGSQIVDEVRGGARGRSLEGSGRRLKSQVEGGQRTLHEQSKSALDRARAMAAEQVPEIDITGLREFARGKAELRAALDELFDLQGGEKPMTRELKSIAGMDDLAQQLADYPPEVRTLIRQAILDQGAGAPTSIPTPIAFELLNVFGERAPSPEALAPGTRGGTLKGLAGELRRNIDSALEGTTAGRALNVARKDFKHSLNRLDNDPSFARVMGAQSQQAPMNLLKIDVRDIPRIRAAAGAEAFQDAAANLLTELMEKGFTEGTLSTDSALPDFFRADVRARPGAAEKAIAPLNEAGRGARIFRGGADHMRAINDWMRALDRVSQSGAGQTAGFIGRMTDITALASVVDLAAQATIGQSVLGGAATAGIMPAVALRLAAEIAVRPGGAVILKGMTENISSPGKQLTFWAQRAGDFIRKDEELRSRFEDAMGNGR